MILKYMRFATVLGFFALVIACGGNIFDGMLEPANDRARLEEAERLVDDMKYEEALQVLAEVESNSNRLRSIEAAAILGAADVKLWDIIAELLKKEVEDASISFDVVFDSLSDSFFGSGEERSRKLTAMRSSVAALLAAPDPEERQLKNLSCFVGSFLSIATVNDGEDAISEINQALTTIQNSATGSASSDAECPGVQDLETGLDRMNEVRDSLTLVLQATDGCGFIDLGASSPNKVEAQLNRVIDKADKGCQPNPSCGTSSACQALSLSCVQNKIDITEAEAGDSQLASCELVQNCIDSDCF